MDVICENVSKSYTDATRTIRVLEDVDLQVTSGTSLAIVGESGVGKTTLLHILGTLESFTTGRVQLGDFDIGAAQDRGEDVAPFRGENIGFVFQFHYLLPEFSATENVAIPLRIAGWTTQDAEERANELLEHVGLKDRLTHRPPELSGGEQQRVAIARALAPRPGLLLADEPTGNLDVRTGAAIHELLLAMGEKEQTTLIVVTHSQDLAKLMGKTLELTPSGLHAV